MNYTNKEHILNTIGSTIGNFFSDRDRSLLNGTIVGSSFTDTDIVELHVYDLDGKRLTSNHSVDGWKIKLNSSNNLPNIVQLNSYSHLNTMGLSKGEYTLVYNFFRNLDSGAVNPQFYIDEISDSRTEIRLRTLNPDLLIQLSTLLGESFSSGGKYYDDLILNFGNNNVLKVVNYLIDSEYIILKLYDKLLDDNNIKDKCWLTIDVRSPYVIDVRFEKLVYNPKYARSLQPNFDVNIEDINSVGTEYKSWNDILSSNLLTSQQIIDKYLSGSFQSVELNINYSDPINFIHFSSATERVKNFRYKLRLIEQYDARLDLLSNSSGSVKDNLVDTFIKRSNLVAGFDNFEKYLYFESGSYFTNITGSINPWPKGSSATIPGWQNSFNKWITRNGLTIDGIAYNAIPAYPKYTLLHTTASEASTYYDAVLVITDDYDRENIHNLNHTIPDALREAEDNTDMELFVSMLGQHYDILWSYINHLTDIHVREEHPKQGLSDDLLYDVAQSMGWKLSSGNKNEELWSYAMGTTVSGSFATTGSLFSKSSGDRTKEVWRRILNNLPYILKTKGTIRSIKALLACYGVPSTLLSIREYGGPSTTADTPLYILNKVTYATKFNTSGSGQTFVGPMIFDSAYPNSIEMGIQPSIPTGSDWKTIVDFGGSTVLEYQKTGSNGNIRFVSGSTSLTVVDQNIFDQTTFTYILITKDSSNAYLRVKQPRYGKLVIDEVSSGSITGWTFGNTFTFGTQFTGSAREFRLWSTSLNNSIFGEHALSAESYHGNDPTSSYYDLQYRMSLSNKVNLLLTSSIASEHPNQLNIRTGSFSNFPGVSVEVIDEEQYIRNPSIGGNNIYSQKIRLETSTLLKPLDSNTRSELSSYDTHPLDSNKIGVYFSPQTLIDDDMFYHLGYVDLDNYIGAPADVYEPYYNSLHEFSQEYWKKYSSTISIPEYLRFISLYDFSLFDQIRKLLPARTNKLLGLVIEPNILERSKIPSRRQRFDELQYNSILDGNTLPETTGSYNQYSSSIEDGLVYKLTGSAINADDYKAHFRLVNTEITSSIPLLRNLDYVEGGALSQFITGSFGRDRTQAMGIVVTGSRVYNNIFTTNYFYSSSTSHSLNKFYSSSQEKAQTRNYDSLPTGLKNLFYDGCTLTGPAVNETSDETVDGSPVVELIEVSTKELIYTEYGASGSLKVE